MLSPRPPAWVARTGRGFSLIEVVVAMAIAAILATVAIPTFMDSIRKSRRMDAFSLIAAVQQLQERWRSNHNAYAASLTHAATGTPPGLGMASTRTADGYYELALSDTGAAGYAVIATAVNGSSQAGDTRCLVLGAQVEDGGRLNHGSGVSSASIDWSDANRCWAR